MTGFSVIPLAQGSGPPTRHVPFTKLGIILVWGVAGWREAERVGLSGAGTPGPLIVAVTLSLSGVMSFRPPAEAILAAQLGIGSGIGDI